MDENKTATNGGLLTFMKGLSAKVKCIIALALLVVIGIGIGSLIMISKNKEGQLSTISKSSLQKIIEIDDLSTVKYTYNAIATKYAEKDTKNAEYYVAYEGEITAGIRFAEIDIDVNEDEKIVTITLPEITIQEVSVTMDSMEYIFVKDKFETETVSQEAYKLCKEDLRNRIEKEEMLYKMAKDNAISSVDNAHRIWRFKTQNCATSGGRFNV